MEELRQEIYERDGYRCQYPGCNIMGYQSLQLAHRINKGKSSRQWIKSRIDGMFGTDLSNKQIDEIIHHKKNIVSSCAKHNDYFNIAFKPKIAEALIIEIWNDLCES